MRWTRYEGFWGVLPPFRQTHCAECRTFLRRGAPPFPGAPEGFAQQTRNQGNTRRCYGPGLTEVGGGIGQEVLARADGGGCESILAHERSRALLREDAIRLEQQRCRLGSARGVTRGVAHLRRGRQMAPPRSCIDNHQAGALLCVLLLRSSLDTSRIDPYRSPCHCTKLRQEACGASSCGRGRAAKRDRGGERLL